MNSSRCDHEAPMQQDEDKASWDPYQASKLQDSASEGSRLLPEQGMKGLPPVPCPSGRVATPASSGSLDLLSSLPSVPGLTAFSGIPVGYVWSLLLAHTVTH